MSSFRSVWNLNFGACLEVGWWNLEFPYAPLHPTESFRLGDASFSPGCPGPSCRYSSTKAPFRGNKVCRRFRRYYGATVENVSDLPFDWANARELPD